MYFLGGIGGGAIWGLLHRFVRSAFTAALMGGGLGLFVYFAAAWMLWGHPSEWTRSSWIAAVVPGLIAGPLVGLHLWRKRADYRDVSDFLEFG